MPQKDRKGSKKRVVEFPGLEPLSQEELERLDGLRKQLDQNTLHTNEAQEGIQSQAKKKLGFKVKSKLFLAHLLADIFLKGDEKQIVYSLGRFDSQRVTK